MSAATAVHVWDVDSNKSISGENSRERGRGYAGQFGGTIFSITYIHPLCYT